MSTSDGDRGHEALLPVEVVRLLVPLDGSERAARAAPVARLLGTQLGIPVVFVGVATADDDPDALARALVQAAAGSETMIIDGAHIADTILDVAAQVPRTVICMASQGRG